MDVKPLRQWRIEKGYGLKELARRAGVSHTTVLRIERGETHGQAGTYRKLAEALGLPGPLAILEYRQLVQAGEDTPG
ncbi:helix-turn-helix domain-containing protein [Thermorudis peleae]|uniref:helix-turn-helix domain-containing protein n=1 Tax=Thermorudis peleae TaxID=1382356 RepID=UPI00069254B0|nr:helix-turn-helix transcriptional regulator [Thermorudis peleae]